MGLGEALHQILTARKITQKAFAKGIGKSETSVSAMVKNKFNPSPKTMVKIAEFLEIPQAIIHYKSIDIHEVPEDKRDIFKMWYNLTVPQIDEMFEIKINKKVKNG